MVSNCIYNYQDEHGKLLFSKVRVEPSAENNVKSFYWVREEGGIQVKNINGCRKVLYRLPQLLYGISIGQPIFLVEGEKDADTLHQHLIIATTAPGSLEWNEEFTGVLEDADVVILYDNDKTGLKRRDLLCKNLYGRVKRLRVVDLPGLEYREKHGLDITNWLSSGNTIEQFKSLVAQTTDYAPTPVQQTHNQPSEILYLVNIDEFLSLEFPERAMLLQPFLPSQGLVLLVAKRGVGKTHIALGIAYAVASGGTFLRWTAPQPRKVLYIDGEMPAALMKERLLIISQMSSTKPDSESFQLLTPDLQKCPLPDLSRKEGREALEPLLEGVDLIVIDNISCLFRSGSENESESWQEAQEWALDLRRRGKSVLFVHHAGKSGIQRGTSKREDILDAVILLKHSEDYKPEEGACFEIIFDKARHFSGEDARSFQAQLITKDDQTYWELSDAPQEEEIARIAVMKNEGKTIKQIAQEIGLTKSQVEYRTAKAKEKGLI